MIKIIILAAGKGTRMNSNLPKVLHKIYDKTMVEMVVDQCLNITPNIIAIIGHQHDLVEKTLSKYETVKCILQEEQLGTGHAVKQAYDEINDEDTVVIINADMPLINSDVIKTIIKQKEEEKAQGIIVSSIFEEKLPYGRIIKDQNNRLLQIVEDKECTKEQLEIKEVNIGLYCFDGNHLKMALNKLEKSNNKEIYITDVPYYINEQNGSVLVYKDLNNIIYQGINTKDELNYITKKMFNQVIDKHIKNGVYFIDRENTYIGSNVTIGTDTTIYPNVNLIENTTIGNNCIIHSNSTIINSQIENNVIIESSKIDNSIIKNNTLIGPYSNIRPNSIIGNDVKIGSFVEVKNSQINDGTFVSHLSYVGDCQVGEKVEIAAGAVVCNMDIHYNKHKTVIKNNAFIGANCTLIAPLTVGENSIVAAATTVTKDVDDKAFVISRTDIVTKDNYNK